MRTIAAASEPSVKPIVKLIGDDGNAFNILGRVRRALIQAGLTDQAERYVQEATSGDYHHLLATTMRYVEVE